MSPERVRELYDLRPFQPFRLRLSDGSVVPITHPETVAFFPGGRSVVVTSRDRLEIVDLFLVAAIEMTRPRNGGGRNGHGRRSQR